MGSFRVDVEFENPAQPGARRVVHGALVDTGSALSWAPAEVLESLGIERRKLVRFRKATGAIVARWTGSAFVHASGRSTIDDLVFGEPGDLVLLGSRSLGGLNFVVDPVSMRLVDAGAMPAAVAA